MTIRILLARMGAICYALSVAHRTRSAGVMAGLITLLGVISSPVQAAGLPLVISATVDYTHNTLTITGQNFGSGPAVTLDNLSFTTVSAASNQIQIVANFPSGQPASSFTPGTYFLTVAFKNQLPTIFEVAIGASGSQGPAGIQGPAGPQGVAGPAGATGATGAMGPPGPMGATGAAGAQGPAGAQGVAGPMGATGATGATGLQGSQGSPGLPGPQGPPGTSGGNALGTGTNAPISAPDLSVNGPTTTCVLGDVVLTAGRLASNYLSASGQALQIADFGPLFEVVQSAYGGDGVTSFNLPDLRAAAPNGLTYEICVSGNRPNVAPVLPPPGTATTTTLQVSLSQNTLTLSAHVSASTGTAVPTGTLMILDQSLGSQACPTSPLNSGTAGCSVLAPTPGSHIYVATYSGDATFLGSTSAPVPFTIF
jgi:microcystin-dependent protein